MTKINVVVRRNGKATELKTTSFQSAAPSGGRGSGAGSVLQVTDSKHMVLGPYLQKNLTTNLGKLRIKCDLGKS